MDESLTLFCLLRVTTRRRRRTCCQPSPCSTGTGRSLWKQNGPGHFWEWPWPRSTTVKWSNFWRPWNSDPTPCTGSHDGRTWGHPWELRAPLSSVPNMTLSCRYSGYRAPRNIVQSCMAHFPSEISFNVKHTDRNNISQT